MNPSGFAGYGGTVSVGAFFASDWQCLPALEQAHLIRFILECVEYDGRTEKVTLTLTQEAAALLAEQQDVRNVVVPLEFTITVLKPRKRRRRQSAQEQRPVAPVVRSIVLAYQIEQAVPKGRARDYAQVARQVGMTRARVSQIMSLLRLPPALLETLLLADPGHLPRLTERQLRPIVAASEPLTQLEMFKGLLFPIEPR